VQVREQRTKKDYAQFMDWLLKTHYPKIQQIHLVQDNLNTHQAGSFYEWLSLERAHEMKNKLIFHYTPKHGSWLNMAEIDFSALTKQCLDRRIPTLETLQKQVLAWVQERNEKKVKSNWLFDTPKARTKLKRHYVKSNPKNSTIPDSNN
jgi:transposase